MEKRGEFISDLQALIRIPSVVSYGDGGLPMGAACKEALDCFLELGDRYRFAVENGEDHWGSILLTKENPEHELGIIGHLDVVDAGGGWKYPPFEAMYQSGYVIGRGSCDNKGPLVMSLYVLRCLRELDIPLKSSVRLIAGCDEEREMRDVRHYLSRHAPPDFTLNCDGAWPMCIGEKGMVMAQLSLALKEGTLLELGGGIAENSIPDSAFAVLSAFSHDKLEKLKRTAPDTIVEFEENQTVLRFQGRSAHCSTPGLGCNAIEKMLRALIASEIVTDDQLKQLHCLAECISDYEGVGLRISYEDSLSGKTTCTPTMICMRENVVTVRVNIRHAVTQSGDVLIRRLTQRCANLGMQVKIISRCDSRYDSPEEPRLKLLLDTCQSLLGKQHKPYVMGGGTHSRLFPNSIPYGPLWMQRTARAFTGQPHSVDEAVHVDQLLRSMKVYVIALKRLDAYFCLRQA